MTTETNTARKAPVTHKDLTIAYVLSGMEAVGPMLADHTNPVAVLDKTLETLAHAGNDAADLRALRDVFAASSEPGQRGRKPVAVGEERKFKAQQITTDDGPGEVFIRLPLSALGVQKGDKVLAKFEADGVRIVRC